MGDASPSWSAFNLPAEPPWFSDAAACNLRQLETGNHRRPLIHPPPTHIRTGPKGPEHAMEGNGELRARLEEYFRDDKRRDGQVVFEDMAPYQELSEIASNDAHDPVPTLRFESRFESGNLLRAVQVGVTEYDLFLRPDKNSGHVQWYYFMVQNMKRDVPYVFNIVNFVKNKSLYNAGLRPLIYSEKESRGIHNRVGWYRTGSSCAYYRRGARYTLTFTLTFKHDGDTCFLAHCYPYTYTDSQLFLSALEKDPARSAICKRKELCRSLAGNVVDFVEIGENVHSETADAKPSILLSARVHPGETQGSWAIESCIEFLTSGLPAAKLLRSRFTIYVVPMLNPDGVINGHYRCSMSGHDLNRRWANPDKKLHPSIWHLRELVRTLSSRKLLFFCDFHGHSVKKNAFMYGCSAHANQSYKTTSLKGIPPTAMFPLLLEEISPAFSYLDCNFRVKRSKMNTGRVVVNREFRVPNSFTIEISFLGTEVGGSTVHFKIEDLEQIGRDFAIALIKYHLPTQYEVIHVTQQHAQQLDHATANPVGDPMGDARKKNDVDKLVISKQEVHEGESATRKPDKKESWISSSSKGQREIPQSEILWRQREVSAEVAMHPQSDVNVQRSLELNDGEFHDNFIRVRQNRRFGKAIAEELQKCESDLQATPEDNTSPGGQLVESEGPFGAEDEDSGNDSEDSSDEDCDGAGDEEVDAFMDPDVERFLSGAKKRASRASNPPTAKEFIHNCENGFLPKLGAVKFNGEAPSPSSTLPCMTQPVRRSSTGSEMATNPALIAPLQSAATVKDTYLRPSECDLNMTDFVRMISCGESDRQREISTVFDAKDTRSPYGISRDDSRKSFVSARCGIQHASLRFGVVGRAGNAEPEHATSPRSGGWRHAGSVTYTEESYRRSFKPSSSVRNFSTQPREPSPAPKIAHLCAAVEGYHSMPDRLTEFPIIFNQDKRRQPDSKTPEHSNSPAHTTAAAGSEDTVYARQKRIEEGVRQSVFNLELPHCEGSPKHTGRHLNFEIIQLAQQLRNIDNGTSLPEWPTHTYSSASLRQPRPPLPTDAKSGAVASQSLDRHLTTSLRSEQAAPRTDTTSPVANSTGNHVRAALLESSLSVRNPAEQTGATRTRTRPMQVARGRPTRFRQAIPPRPTVPVSRVRREPGEKHALEDFQDLVINTRLSIDDYYTASSHAPSRYAFQGGRRSIDTLLKTFPAEPDDVKDQATFIRMLSVMKSKAD